MGKVPPSVPPQPRKPSSAHLFPPRGHLTSEVQGGRLSGPHRERQVWVPAFRLQERKGTGVNGVNAETRRAGRGHTSTHSPTQTAQGLPCTPPAGKPQVHRPPGDTSRRPCHACQPHPGPAREAPPASARTELGPGHAGASQPHPCIHTPAPAWPRGLGTAQHVLARGPAHHLLLLSAFAGVLRPVRGQRSADAPALGHSAQLLTVCGQHVGHHGAQPPLPGSAGGTGASRCGPSASAAPGTHRPVAVQLLPAGPPPHLCGQAAPVKPTPGPQVHTHLAAPPGCVPSKAPSSTALHPQLLSLMGFCAPLPPPPTVCQGSVPGLAVGTAGACAIR